MASTEAGNSSMSSLSDSDANPPSPVPKSNHLPDRLDFSHVDGGKKTTRRENKDMGKQQDTEKRKLHDGLEDGELSTDSEFEAPRKLQKTDKVEVLARAEVNSSPSTGLEDESSKTDIDTMETEGEGETTLVESQDFAEEFHIVDDAEMDDDDNLPESDDDDLDDNEIYAWLEEGIEKPVTTATKASTSDTQENEGEYTEKQKIILKEIGRNPFEVLPEGWVMVTHNCGMPFYLHKQSRVCTASKPYFLGSGSVRKHSIPVSAIPCLHYRREKEKIAKNQEPVQNSGEEPVQSSESVPNQSTEQVKNIESVQKRKSVQVQSSNSVSVTMSESEPVKANVREPEPVQQNGGVEENVTQNGASTENPDQQPPNTSVPIDMTAPVPPSDKTAPIPPSDKTAPVPPPEIKTVEHTEKEYSIEAEELHKYCEGLFDFKTITVKKFTSWKDKRRHLNKEKSQARPSLPSDIKVITCPIQPADKSKAEKNKRREFVLNPVGKTPLCILHEYVQHVLRVQPEYIFKELECAATPYSATVRINKIDYATGLGSSKKQAKLEGAKKTLEILIPHLQLDDESKPKKDDVFGDMKFFDEISVEDPRISDLSDKAGVNKPYQVLQECLKRNYGMGYRNSEITLNKTIISNQKSEFTITVGKHTASVVSKNKREGKQKAAQAMLQLLHPHIKSWGSILRLYSENTVKGLKEKDDEPVTQLQSKHSSLNGEILNKLKTAMMKLRETREQFTTKGTLRIAYRVPQSQVKNIDL